MKNIKKVNNKMKERSVPTQKEIQHGVAGVAAQMLSGYDPSWNQLLEMTIEQQALYADSICQNHSSDFNFATEQYVAPDTNKFSRWNRTSLSNTAYMALHVPTEDLRKQYRDLLDSFINWKRANPNTSREDSCTIM